jgi:choline dehydrogenase-like flavoprotein
MFAAGAVEVAPGVAGFDRHVTDIELLRRLPDDGPADPRAYSLVISHLFGTCRMGSDPQTSVVRPDFRHHRVDNLFIADASVFPTNLGVNPQISIMTMAALCARSVA